MNIAIGKWNSGERYRILIGLAAPKKRKVICSDTWHYLKGIKPRDLKYQVFKGIQLLHSS